METSVPQVNGINDLKWRVARMLEGALAIYKDSGDLTLLMETLKLSREMYEGPMKEAAHKGFLDWSYVTNVGALLDKVEVIYARRLAAQDIAKCV